jgi:hypothetical protein
MGRLTIKTRKFQYTRFEVAGTLEDAKSLQQNKAKEYITIL